MRIKHTNNGLLVYLGIVNQFQDNHEMFKSYLLSISFSLYILTYNILTNMIPMKTHKTNLSRGFLHLNLNPIFKKNALCM